MASAEKFHDEFVSESRKQLEASVDMIRHCVGQLNDDQVWWRPRDGMNSIGNLLLHLAGNLRQRIGSVIGGVAVDRDRDAEFNERGSAPKGELLRRFEDAAGQASTLIAELTAERLGEMCRYKVLKGPTERSVIGIVIQVIAHLNGHAQEILSMTRMQLSDQYIYMQPTGVPAKAKAGV